MKDKELFYRPAINRRFRGFLPVVVDVETAGFDATTNALLEIALIPVEKESNIYAPSDALHHHVLPFEGAILNQESLEFNKIDPYHPLRFAKTEQMVFHEIAAFLNQKLKVNQCKRCILVGHNAWFDLSFVNAAFNRCKIKNPFHAFTSLDTATLGALIYGHTVLSQLAKLARIGYKPSESHSALYDATVTAELFCKIVNNYNYHPNKNS